MKQSRVLVLVGNKPKNEAGDNWLGLQKQLQTLLGEAITVEIASLTQLVYIADIHPQIYHSQKLYDIAEFDFVLIRSVSTQKELAISVAHYLHLKKVAFSDSYLLTQGNGKLSCSFARLEHGLPVAKTIFAQPRILHGLLTNGKELQLPCIVKADEAKKGKDNHLVSSLEQLDSILGQTSTRFLAQQYVKSDGDYRILVLGYKPVFGLMRRSASGTHLTNTSQGGEAQIVSLESIPEAMLSDAVQASRIEKLEVAGVDMIIDEANGKHYILEVNRAPQIPTGAFAEQKMQAYAQYIQARL